MKDRTNEEQNQGNIHGEKFGTVYKASGGLFVAVSCCKTVPRCYQGVGTRGAIAGFSSRSGARMRAYLRGCMADYRFMVTLTYPGFYTSNGAEVKEHLRRYIQELRRESERRGCNGSEFSAFWFLEFQERGAPHFHIFTTWCSTNQWTASTWYRIVNSEDDRHLRAGTRCEELRRGKAGLISYASKYAAKSEQKIVPLGYENVGRFWGVTGRRTVLAAATFVSYLDGMHHEGVKNVVRAMSEAIRKGQYNGNCEVLKRENGVFVLVMHCPILQRRMRTMVSMIDGMLMRESAMFDCADVEE